MKEKNDRFADYEQVTLQNRATERNLLGLKR